MLPDGVLKFGYLALGNFPQSDDVNRLVHKACL